MAHGRQRDRSDSSMFAGSELVRLARPHQWVKNAVVLAGLVFAQATDQPRSVAAALVAVVAFILASAATYVFNDLHDVAEDRHHPTKRARPLASGRISPTTAVWYGVSLLIASLIVATAVSWVFAGIVLAYLMVTGMYTLMLKRLPIVDVIVIALGFVLRAAGGAVAVSVPISPWLLLCAFLLSLFLGFGKRRAEFMLLKQAAGEHRPSLNGYTLALLDQLVRISAVSALVAYAVYTLDVPAVPGSAIMVVTVPLVAFAIFRYLYLIYGRNLGGSPESLLYRDRWLLGSLIAWAAVVVLVTRFG
ncbi:decaprenyl-phosphate phosphoribosyltransferase [soil metagenome]